VDGSSTCRTVPVGRANVRRNAAPTVHCSRIDDYPRQFGLDRRVLS
jgi:hypothetical protein